MSDLVIKRELVEEYLRHICLAIELCESTNDPYPCEESDSWVKDADGLIEYIEYEPGSDNWENFLPEGWLYNEQADEQVEKLYPQALAEFESEN